MTHTYLDLARRIGINVAHNLAKRIENYFIPAIDVCIYQLEEIKKQLEELKEGKSENRDGGVEISEGK